LKRSLSLVITQQYLLVTLQKTSSAIAEDFSGINVATRMDGDTSLRKIRVNPLNPEPVRRRRNPRFYSYAA